MAFEARAKRIVNVPKSYFWERIRAFDKIKTLLPNNILEVKLPDDFSNNIGDTRYVYLGDPYPGEVIERLDSCYDDSYLTYSIIDKSCLPMVNYVACVSLKEVSERLKKKTSFGNLYFESFGKSTYPITKTKPTKTKIPTKKNIKNKT